MSAITATITAAICAAWAALAVNVFGGLGDPLTEPQAIVAGFALATVSFLFGILRIVRGPAYYRALRAGEQLAEEKSARRGHANGHKPRNLRGEISGEIHVVG